MMKGQTLRASAGSLPSEWATWEAGVSKISDTALSVVVHLLTM